MQVTALETLAVIAREASFSKAAQMRNMTLSAVSMQMKSLEAELGVALFDRSFRPPKLTPLGQEVAQDARRIVEAQAVMRARCLQQGALSGSFRLGFVPSAAARILPEFLGLARRQAPQARIDLVTGLSEQLCTQLRAGQLDAAVVTDISDATFDLHCDTLVREEMVVAAPVDVAADTLGDLAERLPFMHFVPSSGIGKLIARYSRQMNLAPRQVLNLDSIEAIVRCIQVGIGYSLLPRPDVARYGGDLVRIVPCAPTPLFRDVSLATREDVLARIWRAQLLDLLRASLPPSAPVPGAKSASTGAG